jgi:hypothetical protein
MVAEMPIHFKQLHLLVAICFCGICALAEVMVFGYKILVDLKPQVHQPDCGKTPVKKPATSRIET